MKIITPSSFYDSVKNYHLLLDCSFFIDSAIYSKEFKKLVKKLKENNNTFVTIDVIKAEFTVGTQNKGSLDSKNKLIDQIVDYVLPTPPDIFNKHLHSLIETYGPKGKGLSIADLILGSSLQRYSDILLLTKNPKDFPKPLTKLNTYFLMDLDKGLQTYALLEKNN